MLLKKATRLYSSEYKNSYLKELITFMAYANMVKTQVAYEKAVAAAKAEVAADSTDSFLDNS